MIVKSTHGTLARRPEKSAGELWRSGWIAHLPIISKDAGQALIFLDLLVLLHQGKRTLSPNYF